MNQLIKQYPGINVSIKTKQLPSQAMLFDLMVLEMNRSELELWIAGEVGPTAEKTAIADNEEHFDPLDLVVQNSHWRDDLKQQCRLQGLPGPLPQILCLLIDQLDGLGLLKEENCQLQNDFSLTSHAVQEARRILPSLSPSGFGLPSLQEFYLFQLREKGLLNDNFYCLLAPSNIPYLRENRFGALCSRLLISEGQLKKMLQTLQTLRPYPSYGLETGESTGGFPRPDIVICKEGSQLYFYLEESATIEDTMAYFRSKRGRGPGLAKLEQVAKAVHKRRLTLMAIMECILRLQQPYFLGKRKHPQQLTRRRLAQEIDCHESTIGRAIADKWVLWQGELMPLSRLITDRDEALGSVPHAFKTALEGIVQNEDPNKPFSDQEITSLLKAQGLRLARRTVAAYRNALGIPSARIRRWRP